MVANNSQLRWAIWTYLISSCCVTYAAEMTLSQGLETLTVKLVSVALGFSVLGGMASTLPKIVNPKVIIPNKLAEVFKDIVASLFAGMLILLFCIWQEYSWALTFIMILVGGAGNAKIVDLAINNKLAETLFGILERVMSAFSSAKDATKDVAQPPKRDLEDPKP